VTTDNMRSSFERAFEKVEAAEPKTEAPPAEAPTPEQEPAAVAPPTTEAPAEASGQVRDATGKFAPKQAGPAAAQPATPPEPKVAPVTPAAPVGMKPPQSWSPAAKEKWATLPPDMQQEIHRREIEANTARRKAAELQKGSDEVQRFRSMYEPYRGIMQGDPLQVTQSLLQTAAALQTGTPAQKAALVAQVIQGYGVDPAAIADALEGKGAAAQPQQAPPPTYQDPRVDTILSALERQKQTHAERERADVANKWATFEPTAEFLEPLEEGETARPGTVRFEMGMQLRAAAEAGVKMTLEEAYERACVLTPGVRSILQQREAASAATAQKAATQRSVNAASSVRHEATTPAVKSGGSSIRETLERVYASNGSR
jgi:hypothetical protein